MLYFINIVLLLLTFFRTHYIFHAYNEDNYNIVAWDEVIK